VFFCTCYLCEYYFENRLYFVAVSRAVNVDGKMKIFLYFFCCPRLSKHTSLKSRRCILNGAGGIRTPGTFRYNGFQDRRLKPLGHCSSSLFTILYVIFELKNLQTVLKIVMIRFLHQPTDGIEFTAFFCR
jgi:hypothetical protein